jgi:hypothetical protein
MQLSTIICLPIILQSSLVLHIDRAYRLLYHQTTVDPIIAYFLHLLVMGFTMHNYSRPLFHAGVKFSDMPPNIDLM